MGTNQCPISAADAHGEEDPNEWGSAGKKWKQGGRETVQSDVSKTRQTGIIPPTCAIYNFQGFIIIFFLSLLFAVSFQQSCKKTPKPTVLSQLLLLS